MAGSQGRIIFEFITMGGSVKVSAIDAKTGTEVSIVGPANAPRRTLERNAANKLRFVMEKAAREDGRGSV